MDELANDAQVIEAATAGPWGITWFEHPMGSWPTNIYAGHDVVCEFLPNCAKNRDQNAAFIARARTRYPELVAEVRELRAIVDLARKLEAATRSKETEGRLWSGEAEKAADVLFAALARAPEAP